MTKKGPPRLITERRGCTSSGERGNSRRVRARREPGNVELSLSALPFFNPKTFFSLRRNRLQKAAEKTRWKKERKGRRSP